MTPGLEAVVATLEARISASPEVMMVLGSGLGALADEVEDAVEIPFADVPGFPGSGVRGHAGRWISGRLEGRSVLVQAGRFHLYEGYGTDLVCAPVRAGHALGAETLVVTNAAGGIGQDLEAGAVMLLDDHLNLTWRSPLAGPVRAEDERFPDMSAPYDPALQELAMRVAAELGIRLTRGSYAAVLGPSYETPAEVAMVELLGADAVGMSTVPEVIAARACGVRCLGLSLITNRAAGLGAGRLSHDEVLEAGRRAGSTLRRLVRGILRELPSV